jgi:hypothetical protein
MITNDITLATTLCLHGYSLLNISPRPDKPRFADFTFEDVDKEFLTDYAMDKIVVSPQMFSLRIRALTMAANRITSQS